MNTNDAVAAFLVRPGALPPDECEALVRTLAGRPAAAGEIVPEAGSALRRSTVRWLEDRDRAVARRVRSLIDELNDAWFGFHIDGVEAIQLAEYGPGCAYGSHIDLGPGATSRRKLSISIQLSDPTAYTGGDLAFRGVSPPGARARGAAVVFPSYLEHAVRPVTAGVRHSLVAWAVGPPFR